MVAIKHRLAVPDDLAIAGFDDAPTARAAWPQLATIYQPKSEIAAAVDILADPAYRKETGAARVRRALDYRIEVRGSSDSGEGEQRV